MSLSSPIAVTAFRFTSQFDPIPRRIELDGISYDLTGSYKKVTVRSDDGAETIFDVTDGAHHFRLREHLFGWRLISMSSENA
jgi:hypothetical protein